MEKERVKSIELRLMELRVYLTYLEDLPQHNFLGNDTLEEIDLLIAQGVARVRDAVNVLHAEIEHEREKMKGGNHEKENQDHKNQGCR